MLDAVFHRFVDQSPVTVMVGGLLERVLTPEKLDAWFEQTMEKQYTRELLFSTVLDLMSQVVCGIRPSMHAAYQAKVSAMSVSIKSVYNKLNGIEAPTSSALVETDDVWMGDRNFCTRAFLCGIEARSAYFAIRHHQNLPWEAASFLIEQGRIETGVVHEQTVRIRDEDGISHLWRRIVLRLDQPTRAGDTQIVILSNLPKGAATAKQIARLYRQRWNIEQAFQELTQHLNAEINTLGDPSAALFAFALALVAYNILAVVKAALRGVHSVERIEQAFSGYHLADEIATTYQGMMVAIAPEQWAIFRQWTLLQLVSMLLHLASKVDLRRFKKHPRGPKKHVPNGQRTRPNPMALLRDSWQNEKTQKTNRKPLLCHLQRGGVVGPIEKGHQEARGPSYKEHTMTLGSGAYQYRVVEGWGQGSEGRPLGIVSSVAADPQDRVYVIDRESDPQF